jgi:hypothetical protein
MTFDKYIGELITLEINQNVWYDFLKDLPDGNQVVMKDDECCVCREHTKTKTHCNHSLCYVCWEQLPIDGNPLYEECTIDCPICRRNIIYH